MPVVPMIFGYEALAGEALAAQRAGTCPGKWDPLESLEGRNKLASLLPVQSSGH